ncbi:MAG: hypothetical protein AB8G15_08170, partial [Saprospiraceae bacterium]
MNTENSVRIFPINRSIRLPYGWLLSWLFLSFFPTLLIAQVTTWDKTYGGDNFETLRSLHEVSDGYIHAGATSSSISGDVSQTPLGSTDYWLVKTDFAGNIVWDQRYGGSDIDEGYSMVPTTDGGFMVGGWSNSPISGDKTQASQGFADFWVVKTNNLGVVDWEGTFGGNSNDQLIHLQQTSDGGYILGGWSASDISGNKSENSRGGFDYWLVKLDASGTYEWDRTYGGSGNDQLYKIRQTPDGGYIIGGFSTSPADFDKSDPTSGPADYWVIKTDAIGNIEWDRSYGGTGNDQLQSLQLTPDGGYILGGFANSGISGDKSEAALGVFDYWILRIDGSGNKIWDRTFGGAGFDGLISLEINNKGIYTLGGFSDSNMSATKSQDSKGSFDYWVVWVDENGNQLLDRTYGGTNSDIMTVFKQGANNAYLLGGFTSSGIGADKTEANQGLNDNWILRLDCGDLIIDLGPDQMVCEGESLTIDAYNNTPLGCNFIWNDNSLDSIRILTPSADISYSVTVTDVHGCTAADTVAITVNPLPMVDLGNDDSACTGQTFTLDAGNPTNDFIWSPNGEITQTITVSNTGNYAVTVTDNNNCTATDEITITFHPHEMTNQTASICQGDSSFLENAYQHIGGIYRDTLNSFLGCDSIIITTLTVLPLDTSYTFLTSCNPADTGTLIVNLNNQFNCDSTIFEVTTLLPSDTTFNFLTSCNPADTGTVVINLNNQFNCDSTIFEVTTLLPSDTTFNF